ncbi:MAG: hypothetical protein ACPGXZ_13660, partial [Saprospiraceae bacterium]
MKKLLVLIFGLLVLQSTSYGQGLDSFSMDKTKFIKELEKFVTANKRKNIEATFEEFQVHFEGGRFTDSQYVKIHTLFDLMLDKKMRANPYFYQYLKVVNVMVEKGQYETHFDIWMDIVYEYIKNVKRSKLKNFNSYMLFFENFYKEKAIRYTKEKGLQWLYTSDEYEFKLKDNEIEVYFPKTDLIGKRKEDTIMINKSSGYYYPLKFLWNGDKGEVSWSRTGVTENVYASFEAYTVETKKNTYSVKKAFLHHPTYFDEPQEGSFTDKVVVNSGKNGSYPRFKSFSSRILIKEIGENIRYIGGFEMEGRGLVGAGGELNQARLDFYKKDKTLALTAYSDKYIIRPGEYIASSKANVSVYLTAEDSIDHPSSNFRFDIEKRELKLERKGTGNTKTPFRNSFHQIDIIAENLIWGIDSDSISIGKNIIKGLGSRKKLASFESKHYFNFQKYSSFQNISTTNPITIIKVLEAAKHSNEIDANELAKALNPKYSVRTIIPLLQDLVESGFILYDKENELIIVNKKVLRYSDASRKMVDYDVINVISASKNLNAKIDLTDNALDVNGVANVVLSDSQLVAFKPYLGELKIKKNRNIDFDGRLYAGFGVFQGKEFKFDYEEFKIHSNSIDSLVLRIPNPDPSYVPENPKRPKLVSLGTRIENLKGTITIDYPENKSSRNRIRDNKEANKDVDYYKFPMVTSEEPCFVYYDGAKTQNGSYKRDSFFFEINPPFKFDSLDSFDPADLNFDGKLVSNNIFPDFEETLKLRGDLSLGFKTTTPEEGYPIYRKKGRFKGVVSMNNEGLLGEGNFTYLAASINSDDIVFLPNQLTATADSFNLEEFKGDKYQYPLIKGENVSVDWRPYQDSMYVETEEKPFMVFEPKFSLTGRVILTPGGLYGDGLLDWPDAVMDSDNLRFRARGVTADSTAMRIKTEGAESIAFSSANVKADVDFDTKIGKFESNSHSITTSLPANKYLTSMDEFVWDMEAKTIDFKSKSGKATFLSTHKNQDSLSFEGEVAKYNLVTNLLQVDGVPFIQSADAFIYPKDNHIEIEKGAKMKTLEDAVILADTSNRYHTIKKAVVNVLGKKNYTASGGFYEYNVGDFNQEIRFDKIEILKTKKGPKKGKLTTFGRGTVQDTSYFLLDKKMFYQGKFQLQADRKELKFDGFAKINSPLVGDSSWFSIDNWVDRKNVILTYDQPRNLIGQKLYTGIFVKRDTGLIYQRVLTAPYSRRDRPIFTTKGIIKYIEDPTEGLDEFHFGDSAKVIGNMVRGNRIVFNRLNGRMDFEGKFNLADKLPYVKVDAAGEGSMSHDGENIKLNMVIGIDMIIPDKLLNILIKDLETNSFELADATYDKSYVRKGISEFIKDDKKLQKVYKEIIDYDKIYLPKGTNNYTFFFGNAPMEWNPDRYSLVSKKGITLTYIGDRAFHKRLNAYLEVRMSRSRDEINLYIESPSGDFYYFNYQNRVLSVVSSKPS